MVKDKSGAKESKDAVQKAFKELKELVKVPKCKLEFRADGKAYVVCDTKDDVGVASKAIIEGITIELKPEVVKVE